MRERKTTGGAQDSKNVSGRLDYHDDARSQRSAASAAMARSMSSGAAGRMLQSLDNVNPLQGSISKPVQRGPNTLEGKLIFEDPSAVLNLTDDRWNEIVQENLKKFEADKVNQKNAKFAKNKVVQEQQMK